MHFDADQYVEALEPLSITLDGKRYTGRVLSALEMASRYQRWYDKLGTGNISPTDFRVFMHTFIQDVFGWRCWRRFKRLPEEAQVAAMTSFMQAQAQRMEETKKRLGEAEAAKGGIPIVSPSEASPQDLSPPTDSTPGETTAGPPATG